MNTKKKVGAIDGAILTPEVMTASVTDHVIEAGVGLTSAADVAMTIPVGVFKLNAAAVDPTYATPGSMCFDISAAMCDGDEVAVYSSVNVKRMSPVARYGHGDKCGVVIDAGSRALIPTGIVFDLPEGTALLLYPRSGMSLKQDAKLGNCIGVVDNDYVEQTYAIIKNDSAVPLLIMSGDKICQGEVVIAPPQASFTNMAARPKQKTTRNGGFGSTGR